jgi:YegS/Rv2252/BmrU family lipid kinase
MTDTERKILLVFNPHAASKRAKRLLRPILDALKSLHFTVDLRLTRFPQDAMGIVRNAKLTDYDVLAIAGGDGTLFEVLNGLFRREDGAKIPIAILPVGTGNAFARDIGLEMGEWEKAIQLIKEFNKRSVDIGYFKTAGEDHYFGNILGVGFVADVTKTAYRLKWLGNIAYTLGVLWRVLFLKPYSVIIEADGKELVMDNIFIEISNTRYTSNFLMAPNAELDDGLLDITILKPIGRFRLLKLFPKVFTGEHIHLKEVETFRANKLTLKSQPTKVLTPDGELLGLTPIEVKCLPKAIEVISEN